MINRGTSKSVAIVSAILTIVALSLGLLVACAPSGDFSTGESNGSYESAPPVDYAEALATIKDDDGVSMYKVEDGNTTCYFVFERYNSTSTTPFCLINN